MSALLHHGGRLRAAATHYGIPLSDWLDLSTGINPQAYPVPLAPAETWHRLPEEDDGLEEAARTYYGADSLLPVAGSQAAIQALPRLRAPGRIAILQPTYAEHAHAWKQAGHEVVALDLDGWERACTRDPGPPWAEAPSLKTDQDVLVVVNPNNPTGRLIPPEVLLAWHERLAARAGWLVVDEAFMDATPEHSLAAVSTRPGLIVLRSVGKFFGLAGARAGFVLAKPGLLNRLAALLGPWAVPGPSRWAVQAALADRAWQDAARLRLTASAQRLSELLASRGLPPAGGTALFHYCPTPDAARRQEELARRGIWVRRFDQPPALRFGLPCHEADWFRLDEALRKHPI